MNNKDKLEMIQEIVNIWFKDECLICGEDVNKCGCCYDYDKKCMEEIEKTITK